MRTPGETANSNTVSLLPRQDAKDGPSEDALSNMPQESSQQEIGRYQARKARLIAAALLLGAIQSDAPLSNLPQLAAHMSESQWRSISFAAGQSVLDVPARIMAIAILTQAGAQ